MKLREKNILAEAKFDEGEGTLKMSFKFLTAGKATANGRIYPRTTLSKAIVDFSNRLKAQPAYGSSSHPTHEGMELDQVSHMIMGAWMSGDDAIVEIKLLPTQKGKNLTAIIKAGGKMGVSLRADGETKRDEKTGHDLVQPGLSISGVDFVMSPASGCYASQDNIFESAALNEIAEERCKARFKLAVAAGFKGSLGEYKKHVFRRGEPCK